MLKGHISLSEHLQGVILRIADSRGYLLFYVGVAIANFITVVWSLMVPCPEAPFAAIDLSVNLIIITETSLRVWAEGTRAINLRNMSRAAVVDLITPPICLIAALLSLRPCSTSWSVSDTILLVLRNVAQLFRLGFMIQKNRHRMMEAEVLIDLDRDAVPGDTHELVLFDDDDLLDSSDVALAVSHDSPMLHAGRSAFG